MNDFIRDDLKNRLTPGRFRHSLNVAKTAVSLAKRWGANEEKCEFAGLIHDCGNLKNKDEIIIECERYGVELREEDLKCPQVIHSYLSEAVAKEEYKVEDEEILRAVRNHTLGDINMSLVEKIIFIADVIEPGREGGIFQKMREKAYENLDEAVLMSYDETIKYNMEKGNHIHEKAIFNKNKLEEILYGCK